MNDAIDDAMEDYGTESDVDKAYQQVCEEVGIEISDQAVGAGKSAIVGKAKVREYLSNKILGRLQIRKIERMT
jgi:hypothetical protein